MIATEIAGQDARAGGVLRRGPPLLAFAWAALVAVLLLTALLVTLLGKASDGDPSIAFDLAPPGGARSKAMDGSPSDALPSSVTSNAVSSRTATSAAQANANSGGPRRSTPPARASCPAISVAIMPPYIA